MVVYILLKFHIDSSKIETINIKNKLKNAI